jgi:hypothetical protein
VAAITVDGTRLDAADRALLERVLRRADAVCRLRREPLGDAQRTGA